MKQFNIDQIESVLSEQESMSGLLKGLRDILSASRNQWTRYDRFDEVPAGVATRVLYQLMRDDDSVMAILHFIEETNQENIHTLNQQINRYYHNSKHDQKNS